MPKKKRIVLYPAMIAIIMGIAEDSISDMDDREIGWVFAALIEYAVSGDDYFTGYLEFVNEKALSEKAKMLYKLMKQMVDDSEGAYQRRIKK